MEIKTLVRDYLQAKLARGENLLALDEEARPVLRAWMLAAKQGRTASPTPAPAPVREPQAASAAPVETSANELKGEFARMREELERGHEPLREGEEQESAFFRPGGTTPEEIWKRAQALLPRWEPLRALGTLREIPVWGQGARDADIMFVGDAPNYYDEQEGLPFCGEAGGKLDGMLKAMGLTREQVYITHFVKFRPMVPRQTLNNRPPSKEEMRLSTPIVEFEVKHVRPKVIVALGVIAARGLIRRGDLPLAAYQELTETSFCGAPVVVTHHPSYLLRTTALAERRRLWEEMLRVMEMAHLPISAKQRGYFLPKA